ncbi:MAG: DUF116 domain-containing protein [Planctomycetota bacterium]|jgi:hypothetical protein
MTAAPTAKDLNEIMRWLGEDADGAANFDELCRAVAVRKNKEHAARFARVPYEQRIVLVPQCLRRLGDCGATETARGYECAGCMACPAGEIGSEAARLGYGGVYMLKGGRAVAALLAETSPRAVVGVACEYEGALGIMECERAGAVVQFVALNRDGCSETDVDLDEVKSVLAFFEGP